MNKKILLIVSIVVLVAGGILWMQLSSDQEGEGSPVK